MDFYTNVEHNYELILTIASDYKYMVAGVNNGSIVYDTTEFDSVYDALQHLEMCESRAITSERTRNYFRGITLGKAMDNGYLTREVAKSQIVYKWNRPRMAMLVRDSNSDRYSLVACLLAVDSIIAHLNDQI